jgi:hypothetical protein
MINKKSPCQYCDKEIDQKFMQRHINIAHFGIKQFSDEGRKNIVNGKKNTTNCIQYQKTRSTLLSLDGDIFRPFNIYKIADLNKAKEIRACGKPFSIYQQKRTYFNRNKIHWVTELEHGNPTYVPKNLLDRAIADGINI